MIRVGNHLGVLAPKGSDMDAATVAAVLGRLAGDDQVLTTPAEPGEVRHTRWVGERIFALWTFSFGSTGLRGISLGFHDQDCDGSHREYAAEVRRVIEALLELSAATGGRFWMDGAGEMPAVTLSEVLDEFAGEAPVTAHRRSRREAGVTARAEERLAVLLAARDVRLDWLRQTAAGAAGPLDYSRDSLIPLWEWARTRATMRPEPPADGTARVPLWYVVPRESHLPAPDWWTDDTLDLLDGLVHYLCECVRRAVPGAVWELGHRYNDDRPVLTAGEKVLDPCLGVGIGNAIYLAGASPETLWALFDRATGRRTRPTPAENRAQTEAALQVGIDFLARFLAARDARLDWLRKVTAGAAGPLDYSRDSLVPLWAWAIGRLRPRPRRELLDLSKVPMWFEIVGSGVALRQWTDESLAIADGLIYYVGECFVRAVPGAAWDVDRSPYPHLAGRPVLAGTNPPIEPIRIVIGQLGDVYRAHPSRKAQPLQLPVAGPDDLRRTFDDVLGACLSNRQPGRGS